MTNTPPPSAQPSNPMDKDELIGYHKGSINTLLAERQELLRIVQVTENLIQAHATELEKLGVNLSEKK
jgi:hypothetical protein